ncbi:MAG: histidine kinase, partial [Longimicrobiales bacterium]|nr:histidine kinase [Longimicrobiales bacterium]
DTWTDTRTDSGKDTRDESWMRGLIDAALRLPLLLKLVVANTVILLAGVGLTAGVVGEPGTTSSILAGILLVTILLGAWVNTVVVGLALSPLRRLEETAAEVDGGRDDARAGRSALADRELSALMARFDEMLDTLEEARARQQMAASRLVDSEERTRTRIAGQLYGDVGQRLATILLFIGRALREGSPDSEVDTRRDSADVLVRVQDEVTEVLEDIRRTARSLRPPELDDLGIMAAIQAEIRTVDARSRVPVTLRSAPPDLPLEEHVGLALFRLIQEGVSLILQETAPEAVTLAIEASEDTATCEIVAVDGLLSASSACGGDLLELLDPMRERAGWIGGVVSLTESDDPGVGLRIEVPVRGPRKAPTRADLTSGDPDHSLSFPRMSA